MKVIKNLRKIVSENSLNKAAWYSKLDLENLVSLKRESLLLMVPRSYLQSLPEYSSVSKETQI